MRPIRPLTVATAFACALAAQSAFAADLPDKAAVTREAEAILARAWPADGPGGVVLVARGDEILFKGARGLADIEGGTPLDVDDTFRLASVTKQFSAAGLLTLVDEGKVALDDPLSRYVPGFPNGDAITVRQLLDHTSGIKSYTSIPNYFAGPVREDLDTAGMIAVFRDLPVDFAPGADWAYNNSGYVLVGAVIEAVTGMPWHAYLEEALFEPLGMDDTGYGADPEVVAAHVPSYTFADGGWVPSIELSMTQPHAAGALVSSLGDLLTWNRALHEGRVLEDGTYELMTTPAGPAEKAGYGFGIFNAQLRGRDMLQHGGDIPGFGTYLVYLPDTDTTVAVLQNTDRPQGNEEPTTIGNRLAAIAVGDPYPAPVAIGVDAATLEEAQGVYRVDDEAERILRVVDGKLTGQRTGGNPAELMPIAKDTFLYADGFNRFELVRNDAGKITGMRFFPMGEGEGEIAPLTDKPLPAARVEIEVTPEIAARVVGDYVQGPATLRIFREEGQMKAQLTGQPSFPIFAESDSTFFLKVVPAQLVFAPGKVAPSVTLHQGGNTVVFTRKAG